MLIKKCEHCLKPYQPQLQGMKSVICPRCEPECDKAYYTIMKYVREVGGEATVEEAAKKTRIHPALLVALVKDGRFEGKKAEPKEHRCKRCNEALENKEEAMCATCMTALSASMQRHYQAGPGEAVLPSNSSEARQHIGSKRTKGYGIGGKH